jgi:hypothetical protein
VMGRGNWPAAMESMTWAWHWAGYNKLWQNLAVTHGRWVRSGGCRLHAAKAGEGHTRVGLDQWKTHVRCVRFDSFSESSSLG